MAQSPKVAVQIAAVDQFTAVMTRFRSELGKIEAPMRRVQRAQDDQAQAMFGGIGNAMQALQQRASHARSVMSSFAPSMTAVAGAGTLAGLGAMARDFSQAGISLKTTAAMAGVTVTQLNDMQGAARSFGLGASEADGAMLGLNRSIQDAVYGRNSKAAAWFNHLGIDIGTMATGAKSAGDVLPKLIPQLTAAFRSNPSAAADLAAIFDMPASSLPMFTRGTDELNRRMDAAHKLNVMSREGIDVAEKYAESYGNVETSAAGLRNILMTRLGPSLSSTLNGMTAWVEANTKTEDSIKTLTTTATILAGTALFTKMFGVKALGGALSGPLGAVLLPMSLSADTNKSATPDGFMPGFKPNNSDDASMGARLGRWWGGMFDGGGSAPNGVPGVGPRFGAPGGPSPSDAAMSSDRSARGREWHDEFVRQGMGEAQAWGAAANALHENGGMVGGRPGDGGRSTGAFQWNGSRRDNYRRMFGRDPSEGTMAENVKFLTWELNNSESGNASRFNAARTPGAAAAAMSEDIIRPRDRMENRIVRAQTAEQLARSQPAGPRVQPPEEPDLTRGGRVNINQPIAASAGAPSVVRVDINHAGAPNGTTLAASVTGDGAELGKVQSQMRIGRAMPEQNWSRGY